MHAIEAALRKSDRSATDVRQTRATDAAHNSPGDEAGAIALHTTRSIALHKEPEVVMTHSGITADVLVAGLDRIPHDKQGAILAEFPRLALKDRFKECLCNIARRKPESTFDNIARDFGVRYVEGYTSPTLPMSSRMHHFPNRGEVMTRDRIQHVLNIIYEKVFNLGQADLYPALVSGPYLQQNPLFPNGLDAIVGYIKQAGRIPCEVKRVAIDGDLAFVHVRYLDWGGKETAGVDIFRFDETGKVVEHWDVLQPVDEARRPRDGSLSFVTLSLSLLQQISHHERAAYLLDQPTIAKVSKIND
jgi:predicted SnoaL-like aldol condensation-catalyzing enzyme